MEDIITWERLLVLWGLIAPGLGALIAHKWENDKQRKSWEKEKVQLKEKYNLEENTRIKEEEREATIKIQQHMTDSYSKFLSSGSLIVLNINSEMTAPIPDEVLADYSKGFQNVLLIASNECAGCAVEIWNKITELVTNKDLELDEKNKMIEEIKSLRARFMREARKDLSEPMDRNSNPGISIRPALEIGGFGLADVG
jgi:hypothetical protein